MNLFLTLFLRAFAIVCCTAANVRLISGGHVWGMGVTGFLISFLWVSNSRAVIRFDRPWTREAYAAGAALGTVTGWALAGWLHA